jgi:ATP-binding cassette, subfamily B, bacterial HlyB/CyaB
MTLDQVKGVSHPAIAEFCQARSQEESGGKRLPQPALQWQQESVTIGQVLYQADGMADDVRPHQGLWLVCEGQVRLIAWDQFRQQDVSIEVMEAGAIFGFASLLSTSTPRSTASRVIVASPTAKIAYLDPDQLRSWWRAVPTLQSWLQRQADQRSQLTFFKTQTALGSKALAFPQSCLTAPQLQILMPYISSRSIAQGTPMDAIAGCWWLAAGKIASPTDDRTAPLVGEGWTDPNQRPPGWIAQTPLLLYQIQTEDYPIVIELLPAIRSLLSHVDSSDQASYVRRLRQETTAAPERQQTDQSQAAAEGQVVFAQPKRRRRLRWGHPFIAQQSSSDCGVACLAMIGQYWGANKFPLYQLREWAKVGRSGATLKNLASTGEKLGFTARPVRASYGIMQKQQMPWIAHWQGEHYVVVYNGNGQSMLIADPATGLRRVPKAEFVEAWSGYGLMLEPTDDIYERDGKKAQSLGSFGQLLLTYRGTLIQIILVSVLIQCFGLVGPLLNQIIFDRVVTQKSLSMLNVFSIGLLIFGIWRMSMSAVRQYLLDHFANRLELTMVSGFIHHTLSLPLTFFESRNVGDIITRIQENTKIQNFLIRQAVSTWLDAIMAIAYLGLMIYYNAQLAMVVLLFIPPMILLTLASTPLLKKLSREAFKESAEQTSLSVEMMTGIAAIKTAAVEQEIRWRWEERLVRMLNVRFKAQKLANGLQIVGGLINLLGSTVLLWYGSTLVIQGQLSIGQLVAFNMLIGNVLGPTLAVIGVWDELQEVLISVERLNDVFAATPEEAPGRPLFALPPIQGEIRFDQVTFAYDEQDEKPILQGLSFKVRHGETIALVGRSGSGKTTLIKLLQGFYHPTKGRIIIDGHDLKHVSPASLRAQMGVVPQECFLFSGTILENIRLYRPEGDLEDVIEAGKLAEAHSFIQSQPLGYNTKVGERGSNLSGGQRQRIAIARALMGRPGILILDEATSALDTESEQRFQRNLERLRRNRTTFIIAHRLSTVQSADRILVLDRGMLVEQGNHDELIEQHGLYYHLAQQQLNL